MKKMTKSLVMASSILLLGANAYAAKSLQGDYGHNSGTAVIKTITVDTKNEAYSLGFQKLKDLKAKSSRELSETFRLNLRTIKEKNSVSLEDGAYITVQEFMNEKGSIVYKGAVNVTYHFSVEDIE